MKDVKFKFEIEDKTYNLIFNLNVMESIQEEYGTIEEWGKLTDGKNGEPNFKALKYGIMEMLNEEIDIENEENGTSKPFLSSKEVGRLITKFGIKNTSETMNKGIVDSVKDDTSKNA